MTIIDRDQHISEYIIREHVRKRIKKSLAEKALAEEKIRTAVRIILEAETGTAEPSKHTGINVLADLLEKIIPIIDSDYKMLTTSKEQRDSFRNHMVHAIKNSLRPIGAANESDVDKLPENIVFEIDTDLLSEKIKIDLTPDEPSEDSSVEGEFIDIDAPEEGEDFGAGLEDQNETGRNFAAASFKKIEKQIVDAYDMLADEEDQKLFYDYLVTNTLLYFDKFEDELATSLPDTTTPEYEAEKEEEDTEDTADADTTEETPTEETPEEGEETGVPAGAD